MKQVIYCISGLGADQRIFEHLQLGNYELRFISWLQPLKNETIDTYARRMAESINEKDPILLGVSFGGMMSIEIARHISLQRLILVSSIKSVDELPRWMKMAGNLKLNRVISLKPYSFMSKIGNWRLGVSNAEEAKMVSEYRKAVDMVYMEWAVNQILNWKNSWVPPGTIHIHGDEDRIFPIKKIRPTHTIKGATHFMVYNRAKEVAQCIEEALAQKANSSSK
jgi:pimeloyl-ACP methyl ester carboxylesterase